MAYRFMLGLAGLALLATAPASRRAAGQTATPAASPSPAELAAARRDLLAAGPWLSRLSNREDVLSRYARRIAWTRVAERLGRHIDAMPDPASTIVSATKARRRRARRPWDKKWARAVAEAAPRAVAIQLGELLSDEFWTASAEPERAGRRAMAEAIRNRPGEVRLSIHPATLHVYVYMDGVGLGMDQGRLRPAAFLGSNRPALMAIEAVYADAVFRRGAALQSRRMDESPELWDGYFDELIAEQRQEAIDRELAVPAVTGGEVGDIRAIRAERRRHAGEVRGAVAAAVVSVRLILTVFAIEGASDVFLALFPFGKAAGAVKKLFKTGKSRRAGKQALEELSGMLDADEARFVRAAEHLLAEDLLALNKIAGKVQNPDVMTSLMVHARKGQADLGWLAGQLDKGRMDGDFVDNFMRYDANPTWKQLQDVVDNRVHGNERTSVMSKLLGFLGEEGGAAHVKSAGFARKHLDPGDPLMTVKRGEKKLDQMARTRTGRQLFFSEVKNCAADTWNSRSYRREVLDQLDAHNRRIDQHLRAYTDEEKPRVIKKLLMVEEKGFEGMDNREKRAFLKAIDKKGWEHELIPNSRVEGGGEFIDRMRKGE